MQRTGHELSFGFVTTPERLEVEALEALPIASLWVGGHVASRNPSPEAMAQLARLAGLAGRARIGTSILLLPLYPPAIVAKQLADLDQYTGGRVSVGIGVGGEYPQEFRACGVPLAERGARTDEAIEVMRKLWTGEEITHRGRYFPMEKVRILPRPRQVPGPPIIVAGRQEVAMRRAALLGDGWMPYLYSPRRYAESVERIGQLASQAGRSLETFEWLHFLFTNVQSDASRARSEAAGFLGGTYDQDFNAMIERVAAAGNPKQVASRVREFVDAGARHIIFALATGSERLAMAQAIAREVIPRVVEDR
jgi:probable F420-dependent oxidoreductase